MVSINPNFGPQGLGRTGKSQTTNEPKKPTTQVEPLVIWQQKDDGRYVKIYDDGKNPNQILVLDKDGKPITYTDWNNGGVTDY